MHHNGRRIYTCKIEVQSAGSEDQESGGGIMETMELLACVLNPLSLLESF